MSHSVLGKVGVMAVVVAVAAATSQAGRQETLTIDHYVRVRSSAPAMLAPCRIARLRFIWR